MDLILTLIAYQHSLEHSKLSNTDEASIAETTSTGSLLQTN